MMNCHNLSLSLSLSWGGGVRVAMDTHLYAHKHISKCKTVLGMPSKSTIRYTLGIIQLNATHGAVFLINIYILH